MREISIDYNTCLRPVPAGYIGEHNATTLQITPPVVLSEADYYRAAFGIAGDTIYSERLTGDILTVPLWQQLTQQSQVSMTLEGYKEDGSYIGKAPLVTLIFRAAVNGTAGEADTDPHGLAAEVAANTAARHTHDNKPTLDKLAEADATLMFDGRPIGGGTSIALVDSFDDLDPDAVDGSIGIIRADPDVLNVPITPYDFVNNPKGLGAIYLHPNAEPDDFITEDINIGFIGVTNGETKFTVIYVYPSGENTLQHLLIGILSVNNEGNVYQADFFIRAWEIGSVRSPVSSGEDDPYATLDVIDGWRHFLFYVTSVDDNLVFSYDSSWITDYARVPVIRFTAVASDMTELVNEESLGYFANVEPYYGGRPSELVFKDTTWKRIGDRT